LSRRNLRFSLSYGIFFLPALSSCGPVRAVVTFPSPSPLALLMTFSLSSNDLCRPSSRMVFCGFGAPFFFTCSLLVLRPFFFPPLDSLLLIFFFHVGLRMPLPRFLPGAGIFKCQVIGFLFTVIAGEVSSLVTDLPQGAALPAEFFYIRDQIVNQ